MTITQSDGCRYDIHSPNIVVSVSGNCTIDQSRFVSRVDGVVLTGESMGVKWKVELTASDVKGILTLVPDDLTGKWL